MTLKFKETAENEDNSNDFKLIKKYINKDSVALDIGACIGNFTRFLAENCKTVYAFEPSPNNMTRLVENIDHKGHFTNVEMYEIAIGDRDCESTLYVCSNDIGMNRLYDSQWCKGGEQIHNIMTCSIDNLLTNVLKKEKRIDFIKIDVEGYEYYIIMGMKKLLRRDHPTIMLEFHCPSLEEAKSNPETLYNFMVKEMRYQQPILCHRPNKKINSYEELDSICRYKAAVNLLWT